MDHTPINCLPYTLVRYLLPFLDIPTLYVIRHLCRVVWLAVTDDCTLPKLVNSPNLLQLLAIPVYITYFRKQCSSIHFPARYIPILDRRMCVADMRRDVDIEHRAEEFDKNNPERADLFIKNAYDVMHSVTGTSVCRAEYENVLSNLRENDVANAQCGEKSFEWMREYLHRAVPTDLLFAQVPILDMRSNPEFGIGIYTVCHACGKKIKDRYTPTLLCMKHKYHPWCAAVLIDLFGRENFNRCIGTYHRLTLKRKPTRHRVFCVRANTTPELIAFQKYAAKKIFNPKCDTSRPSPTYPV